MAECRMVSFLVPEGPPSHMGAGATVAISRCETHNWDFGQARVVGPCPIGRIEAARDEAIAKIREAANASRPPPA